MCDVYDLCDVCGLSDLHAYHEAGTQERKAFSREKRDDKVKLMRLGEGSRQRPRDINRDIKTER